MFDGIGMQGFADAWACVNQRGILAAFGFSDAVNRNAPGWKLGWWLLRLHAWNWLPNGKRARFYSIIPLRKQHPAWYRADLEQLFALLAASKIHPRIAERIPLDAVADAHRQLEAGGLTGKIILCP